ncbi:MAG: efflux RND transporter permease subunit, partial [Bacteroidota bacterium]
SFYRLLNDLRDSFKVYAGAKITISELKNGPPIEAPVAIRVVGESFDTLKVWAKKVEDIIARTEGIINVDNPSALNKTDLKVRINKDKAGMIGLPIEDIDLAVRAALTGIEVSQVNFESGDKYDMVLRIPFEEKPSIEDFEKIYIPTRGGDQVPLKQVAQLEFQASASEVLHYNLERNFTVTADVLKGYNINNVSQEVISGLSELKFPKGYTYRVAGELEAQSDSFGGLGQILVIALVGIFAVLVLQFRSFAQPFIVFSAIPLAFVVSILALFITGWTFSFFAFVGFTSLVGIVINNSIILVDYTNQLLERGIGIKESIIQACETRFTPIILTTLTTIFGLLPLTLTNSGLWSPLGWTIIGGMITSTFLTLLVVPILYIWLTKPKEKLKPVIKA